MTEPSVYVVESIRRSREILIQGPHSNLALSLVLSVASMICGRPGRLLARLTKIDISDCLELLGCSEVRLLASTPHRFPFFLFWNIQQLVSEQSPLYQVDSG